MKSSNKWFFTLSVMAALLGGCGSHKKKEAKTAIAPMINPSGGPVQGTAMSDEYIKQFGRETYFWGWPLVNVHNRKMMMDKISGPSLVDGNVPVAPINHLAMLTDYVDHKERLIACPNQDMVYGFGMMDLNRDAVVIQVPDFKDRYWVYQLGNQRTDAFAQLGTVYKSSPGFYLLVGPNWNGKVPEKIKAVFRSPTSISYAIPRVFMAEDPKDKKALLPLISQINMYPLAQFDGKMKTTDWEHLPKIKNPMASSKGGTRWVNPQTFFDQLGQILSEVPPLPGEESMYDQMKSMLSRAAVDPKLKAALKKEALNTEKTLIKQAFYFRNGGVPIKNQWHTYKNGAEFGKDYLSRTTAARSNIFINPSKETMYFATDYDGTRVLLNGKNKYTMTFSKDEIPPVDGFWSLTSYNGEHFFDANFLSRYSIGTKTRDLVHNDDGSITIYLQSQPPTDRIQLANWLPIPKGAFSLMVRAYSPKQEVIEGKWSPPAVNKVQKTQISQAK